MSDTKPLSPEPRMPAHADVTAPDAASDDAALHAAGRPPLSAFVVQYWKSSDKWMALSLLLVGIGLTFFGTYLMVWANKLVGEVTDALVNKRWGTLLATFATSVGVGVLGGVVVISNVAITNVLDLRWRAWLTERLLARWTACSRFYDIERDGLLKNADQRIAEDVRIFTDSSLNLFTNLIGVTTQIVTFTVVLWGLSQTLDFQLFGSTWVVHGYLVYICLAYAVGGLLITHYFGRKLIALNMQKQGAEADYRYLAMQLRENAEQVALYDGGAREHRRLSERFAHVKQNFLRIVARTWKVDMARMGYGHLFEPLNVIAALPLYFAGKVTYGEMMRAAGAFNSLKNALGFFMQAYVGFTSWLAVTNRLRDLHAALDAAERLGSGGFQVRRVEQAAVTTGEITLKTPKGELLTVVPPLAFRPGERWLVRGPSGTGKSTLLRAIAGIWPHGTGSVSLPRDAGFLFLPQRSYIPSGSLAAAISYPAEPTQFSEAQLQEALQSCGLPHLVTLLDSVDHWQQRLSGGEQQRLAFARVLLHRPAFVFLDEATSAVDPATEQRLYQAVLDHLPGTTVISVAHRESLAAYHDQILDIAPAPGRTYVPQAVM